MSPPDRRRAPEKIPVFPVRSDVLLAIPNLGSGDVVSGTVTVHARLTGEMQFEELRLYVDGELQGERMAALQRNRHVQEFDSATFLDGAHDLAVAAVDARGKLLHARHVELVFQNVGRLHVTSLRPTAENDGYLVYLKIMTARLDVPIEAFQCIDDLAGEKETLTGVSATYEWASLDGAPPVGRLEFRRPGGAELADGAHRVTLNLLDNRGALRAHARRDVFIGAHPPELSRPVEDIDAFKPPNSDPPAAVGKG